MGYDDFKIDANEPFDHLPDAPIVEAVIHWQAVPEAELEQKWFRDQLEPLLEGYAEPQVQRKLNFGGKFDTTGKTSLHQTDDWHGFRIPSKDESCVAQFTREGFALSHLKPYTNWEQFKSEAVRLWEVYCKIAKPSEVQRLGVRFINQIGPVNLSSLGDLLTVVPASPKYMPLPLKGFMHQSRFDVPGHPYNLNVIQTIPAATKSDSVSLILDFDVFTTRAIQIQEIDDRLQQMHWIKNKAFFSFLTADAIGRYKE
ncbi:MAG: TIGR04255 family protein [Pirellulales bacterium]